MCSENFFAFIQIQILKGCFYVANLLRGLPENTSAGCLGSGVRLPLALTTGSFRTRSREMGLASSLWAVILQCCGPLTCGERWRRKDSMVTRLESPSSIVS